MRVTVYEVQWWPVDEPIPEGWREVEDTPVCHHHRYSRLIERSKDEPGRDVRPSDV